MDIDNHASPDAEALLEAGADRRSRPLSLRRELPTRVIGAVGFLAAAGLLAALAPWHRSLSVSRLLLLLIAYVLVERVRFPVAGVWTYPTMLVFVPMLFILPTAAVPLAAMLAILLGGAQRFSWSHWLLWVYLVDAMLAPLGLLVAASAVTRPGLVLLALPVVGLLWLFARERKQRLDQTLVLSSAYQGTALLLGEVIEADDRYTGFHSRQVVDLALALADAVGLDAERRQNVEFTALLHEVGKIRVPKEILNKPGRLDESEWQVLHRHTIDGERMLRQVGGALASVGEFVRASHERYDGTGYPDRIAGEQIPIEARIVAVCDAYNAMTTDRPYRAAISSTDAIAELRRGAGSQFDPVIVDVFVGLQAPPVPASPSPPTRTARILATDSRFHSRRRIVAH